MSIQVLMPALSPTMSEGKLTKWLVKEGDLIKAGDLLAEIETDKAIMEFESSEDGIVKSLLIKEGEENIKVNEPIALLETSDSEREEDKIELASKQDKNVLTKTKSLSVEPKKNERESSGNNEKEIVPNNRVRISPLAKKIALKNNINFKEIKGSGPLGRIIKVDINNYIRNVSENQEPLNDNEEYIPLNSMRKTIAERLSKSKREIPHFYLRKKVYIDKLLSARKLLNTSLEHKKVKISINDIILKAISHALHNHPNCNVTWGENKIIKHNSTDVAVAVAIEDGLLTPVIKNVKNKTLSELSKETKSLIERSKNRRLKADELTGGSITISNLGMMGIDSFDAIINPPQGSILAVGQAEEVIDFDKNNNVIKKTIIQLTLSVDHRMIDGAAGAKFLKDIASFLEEPIYFLG